MIHPSTRSGWSKAVPAGVVLVLLLLAAACAGRWPGNSNADQPVFALDKAYQDITRIQASADCIGPPGRYTSEIHSFEDDYIYFHQKFKDRPGEFKAVLLDTASGYSFDINNQLKHLLNKQSVQIVRSHDFHRMALFPHIYCKDLQRSTDLNYREVEVQAWTGLDPNGNHATVYYNPDKMLVAGVQLRNPADTNMVYEVYFDDWRNSAHGRIPYYAEVVQAEKDTFQFHYSRVTLNNMDMPRYRSPEEETDASR
jgi:hypothetical protein